jgi:hypothetical protein
MIPCFHENTQNILSRNICVWNTSNIENYLAEITIGLVVKVVIGAMTQIGEIKTTSTLSMKRGHH